MKGILLLVMILLQMGFSSWKQSWLYYCADYAPLTEEFLSVCDSSRGGYKVTEDFPSTNIELSLNEKKYLEVVYQGVSVESPLDSLPAKEIQIQDFWDRPLASFKKGVYFTLTGPQDSIQTLMVVENSTLDIFSYHTWRQYIKAREGWVLNKIVGTSFESWNATWYDEETKRYRRTWGSDSSFDGYASSKQMARMSVSKAGDDYAIWDYLSDGLSAYKIEETLREDGSRSISELDCDLNNSCTVTHKDVTPEGDTTTEKAYVVRNKKGEFRRRFFNKDTLVVTVPQRYLDTDVDATYLVVPNANETFYWRSPGFGTYAHYRPVSVLTTIEGVEVYGKCEPCTQKKCGDAFYQQSYVCSYSDKNKKVWGSFCGYNGFFSRYSGRSDSPGIIWKHGKTSEGTYRAGTKIGF